jgi:hypothetical protein
MTDMLLIDDFRDPQRAHNGNRWQYLSDQVMGGVSQGRAGFTTLMGRSALRLRGDVSLANNGGFVQVALDLGSAGGTLDAGDFDGVSIAVLGDGQRYGVHLRTRDLTRPWQSYRVSITTSPEWTEHHLPFRDFVPHRTEHPLDRRGLRRIGVIALGRAGGVDIAIASLALYRERFL